MSSSCCLERMPTSRIRCASPNHSFSRSDPSSHNGTCIPCSQNALPAQEGNTPLIHAVKQFYAEIDIVHALLKNKAQIRTTNAVSPRHRRRMIYLSARPYCPSPLTTPGPFIPIPKYLRRFVCTQAGKSALDISPSDAKSVLLEYGARDAAAGVSFLVRGERVHTSADRKLSAGRTKSICQNSLVYLFQYLCFAAFCVVRFCRSSFARPCLLSLALFSILSCPCAC